MTTYLFLSDRSGNWRRPAVPLGPQIEARDPRAGADPLLSVETLTPAGLRAVMRDERLLTAAPAMPTRLISPAALDGLRAEGAEPGWGLRAVGAPGCGFDGAGVRVALLDTGLEAAHPAFAGLRVTGRDFAGTGLADANGHGTHLAATILGRDCAGRRLGVARGVPELLVGKAVADNGLGRSEDFLRAVLWALQEKAHVLGFALSFDTMAHITALTRSGVPQSLANAAAVHAYRGNLRIFEMILQMLGGAAGTLILGAVGNDGLRVISERFETGPAAPAAARGVLSVGALSCEEGRLSPAPYSNMGPALAAPGSGIVSAAIGGGTRMLNGTSMAMAHAVGVAALWAQYLREGGAAVTAESLAARLVRSASRAGLEGEGARVDIGAGRVQAPR
jgi:subtilisin family serine protease